MRELRIPTRKTNPTHNDVPENTTFLLFDQPSGEEKTMGTLINKINEVAINAKTANWKAIVIFLILQTTKKRTILFDSSFFNIKKVVKKCIMGGLYPQPIDSYDLLTPLSYFIRTWSQGWFFSLPTVMLNPTSTYLYK